MSSIACNQGMAVPFWGILLICGLQFLHTAVIHKSDGSSSLPRTLTMDTFTASTRNNNTLAVQEPPFNYSNSKYCLIHIGKAAGSKVSCELDYTYAPECNKRRRQASSNNMTTSILQKHRGGVRHMGLKIDCSPQMQDDSALIVTLRNPIQRLISWYKYEHLQNRRIQMNPKVKRGISCLNRFHKYQNNEGCFATLSDFAVNALPPNLHANNNRTTEACQQLAWDVASGNTPCMWHNHMGYQYYMNIIHEIEKESNSTPHLLVMRAEHLQQDWDSIETLFGGTHNDTNHNLKTTLNKSQQRKQDVLSKEGTRNLCRALCREIQVYKELLSRAENLSPMQREESIAELLNKCPEETQDIQVCESHDDSLKRIET